MKNEKIRQAILKNRIKYYEVAAVLGISPSTFSVWLRNKLSTEKEQKILKAIDEVSEKLRM